MPTATNDKTFGTIVTNAANAAIVAAIMNDDKINITTLIVGDGNGAYYQPTPDMTALKNQKWSGPAVAQINENSPNMIDVSAIVPSSVGGFTIREMAVLADDGTMVAICNTPDTEKVVIASGANGEIELTMHIEVSNTGVFTFVIDPNVITATKKDIERHNNSTTAHDARFALKAGVDDLNMHKNNVDIHVTPESMANLYAAINDLVAHTEDTTIHVTPEDKASWIQAVIDAATALAMAQTATNTAAENAGRISRLEDGVFNNITANPFIVSFESLAGLTVTKGVYNVAAARIEC